LVPSNGKNKRQPLIFGNQAITTSRFIWSKVLENVKIQSYTTKNIIYLDVSTSTGSLHQKNEVIISSSGSWHKQS